MYWLLLCCYDQITNTKKCWGGITYLVLGFRRLSPPITWPHVLVHNTVALATVQRKVLHQEQRECQHLTGFFLFLSNSVWALSPGMVSSTFRVVLPISPVNLLWKNSHRPPEEHYTHLLIWMTPKPIKLTMKISQHRQEDPLVEFAPMIFMFIYILVDMSSEKLAKMKRMHIQT